MIDAVVSLARVVQTIAFQLPVANKSWLDAVRWTIVRGSKASGSTTAALGLTVLVVDDNPVNREVAVAMLEESRCRVTLAHDGHAAGTGRGGKRRAR